MENKLMTAKSYANCQRVGGPFEKNGKPYTKVKEKCDRCNGRGEYWWGAMINGRPQFSGTCYQCNGARYLTKEVRLYTEEEYKRMETANERARSRKAEEREAKMKAEFAGNRSKWLEENGWSQDGITYVVTGDSYTIKEELKKAGFHYDPVLKWHRSTKEGYEDKVIEINLNEVVEFSAWGQGYFLSTAKALVEEKIAAVQPESTSEWIGEVGDKLKDIKVQLTRKYSFDSKYGVTTIYNFVTEDGNNLTWFSSTYQPYDIGEWMKIKYTTIKDHNEYKGVKSTVITRTKLVDIEPAQEVYDEYNWDNEILNG